MAERMERVPLFAGIPQSARGEVGWVRVLCVGLILWLAGCDHGGSTSTAGSGNSSAKMDPVTTQTPDLTGASAAPHAAQAAPPTPGSAVGEPATAAKVEGAIEKNRCAEVCDRTMKLGCGPRATCLEACSAANDGSICGDEMNAFMDCALTHPASHWECSENGVAAIRQGYCDREQQSFMHCFTAASGGT